MKLAKYISTISFLYQIHAALAEGIAGAGSNETGAIYGGNRASRIDGYVLTAGFPRCGGQLIYTDIVLTAAHCARPFTIGSTVRLSPLSVSDYYETNKVAAFSPHPSWNEATHLNDIALIRLESPSLQGWSTLATDASRPTYLDKVKAVGFGMMDGGLASDYLMEVRLTVDDNANCQGLKGSFNPTQYFCSGRSFKGGGEGDSGGPIFADGSSNFQYGIMSYKNGASDGSIRTGMTRVSYYNQWIKDNICLLTKFPSGYECTSPAPPPTPSPSKRRVLSSLPPQMTDEEWISMKDACSTKPYTLSLSITGLHLAVIAVPQEDTDDHVCPSIALHALPESEDAEQSTIVKCIHKLQDDHKAELMAEGVIREAEDRTFQFWEVAKVFDQAEVGGNDNYNFVTNNCASLPIHMASGLGVEIDDSWIDFVSERLLLEKETLSEFVRASPGFHRLLTAFGHVRKLFSSEDNDSDLVKLLVKNYMTLVGV